MAERSVVLRLEAIVQNFVRGFQEATKASEDFTRKTKETDQATKEASKSSKDRAKDIDVVARADQRAAKAAGLLYNANGQLADSNGKVLGSAQAAAHGLDAFSESVYLANEEAQQAAAATTAAVERQKEAYQTLAPAVTIAGGLVSAGFAKMLHTYATFDQSMAGVQAATHETASNMELLREAAIRTGADTAFSAQEAAAGITEMAKAGVETRDILAGGLDGTLALAASDNLEVAKAAEIAASAMTQFKLTGEQIPHVADLLAAGAGKAQGGVEDLGMALNQSGLVASATGLTIEETTGALSAFASAGLIGSDAGTSFKTMLQALTPNSAKAANLMDELGISAYDANGEFIGMANYAGVLQDALRDMSDEQRQATMKTIFGSDAVRAATVLYEQGAEGVRAWEDAVNDAGYAAETAAIMQDNLAGDVEKLGGAFDTVFLKSGSGANDALRGLVQGAEAMIDVVGKIPEPILALGGILTGVAGGTALVTAGAVSFIPRAVETVQAFRDLQSTGSKLPGMLGKVTKGVGLATVGFTAFAIAAQLAGTGLDDLGSASDYIDKLTDGATDVDVLKRRVDELATASGSSQTSVRGLGDALGVLNQPGIGKAMDWVGSIGGLFDSDAKLATQAVSQYDEALKQLLASGAQAEASQGFKIAVEEAREYGVSLDDVVDKFPGYIGGLEAQAEALGVNISQQSLLRWALYDIEPAAVTAARGARETADALDEVGVSTEGVIEDMEEWLELLYKTGVLTRDQRAAYRDYQASIDDIGESIKKNGTSLDAHTEKGRANQAALDGLAAKGQAYVESLAASGASEEELQAAMTGTYDAMITAAGQFGITGEAADKLAREIIGIPDDVKVETWMSETAKKAAEQTKKAIEDIPKRHDVKIVQTFETHGSPYKPANPISTGMSTSNLGSGFDRLLGRSQGGDLDMAPGPVGVDSMIFKGARGEHVFTAEDVAAMGGQQAVYRFRSQLHSGQVRGYASGGELGAASVSILQSTASPSSVAPASGSGMPSIEVKIFGATDSQRVAREVTDQITDKLAKVGMRIG